MTNHSFGDLRDWGQVLDQLATLKASPELDDHQKALRRLLRYRQNWRLREAAIDAIGNLKTPSEELVSEMLAVVADEESYCELRVHAADVLASLLSTNQQSSGDASTSVAHHAVQQMQELLESPQQPVLHEAIRRSVKSIGLCTCVSPTLRRTEGNSRAGRRQGQPQPIACWIIGLAFRAHNKGVRSF